MIKHYNNKIIFILRVSTLIYSVFLFLILKKTIPLSVSVSCYLHSDVFCFLTFTNLCKHISQFVDQKKNNLTRKLSARQISTANIKIISKTITLRAKSQASINKMAAKNGARSTNKHTWLLLDPFSFLFRQNPINWVIFSVLIEIELNCTATFFFKQPVYVIGFLIKVIKILVGFIIITYLNNKCLMKP